VFQRVYSVPRRAADCSPVSGSSLVMVALAEVEKCVASKSVMPASRTRVQSCAAEKPTPRWVAMLCNPCRRSRNARSFSRGLRRMEARARITRARKSPGRE